MKVTNEDILNTIYQLKVALDNLKKQIKGKISDEVEYNANSLVNIIDTLDTLVRTKATQNLKKISGDWIKTIQDIRIVTEDDKEGELKKVTCYINNKIPGIMIHKKYTNNELWIISHIKSGRCLTKAASFIALKTATNFVEEHLAKINWDIPKEELIRSEQHIKIIDFMKINLTIRKGKK